ncbi:hypothetical protein B0O99DRAFT_123381 [Bisporella sp. PMI_857]|nr:hypothetical protein B0O99DRAFT_123381 [Bisporella sp. PMI_857]
MNWATVEPKTRLYKGKELYRWDVSPGLEHHCGTCATPLHIHVEPCYRFHQQLHFVGKAHECFGCNKSDEMHHVRHKEILKLVRLIIAIDEPKSLAEGLQAPSSGKSRQSSIGVASSGMTDTSSDTGTLGEDGRHLTRSERKKAKKSGTANRRYNSLDVFPQESLDFVSEAIHRFVHDSKGAWRGTYNYDKPIPKTQNKDVEEPSTGFAGGIERFTALSLKNIHDLTPRQRKIVKKETTPTSHTSFGGGSRKYTPKRDCHDAFDGVDQDIFRRLGIVVVDPPKNSAARKDLVSKLIAAIKADLCVISQEETEAIIREEGFWRWAGKNAWHNIMGNREHLDWVTGQKIDHPRPGSTSNQLLFDASHPPAVGDEIFSDLLSDPLADPSQQSDVDKHAVKAPTGAELMLAEDSDSEKDTPAFFVKKEATEIMEELLDDGFEIVTKKRKHKSTSQPPLNLPTKNLAIHKALRQNKYTIEEEDGFGSDFTPEAMAAKLAGSRRSKADSVHGSNSINNKIHRQRVIPRH